LINQGYAKDQQAAFEHYLIPFNIPKKKLSPKEGIELINQAKGLAVLAHPSILTDERQAISIEDQLKLFNYMLDQGIDGIEAFYTGYDQAQVDFYLKLAHKHQLLITAGSDFHSDGGRVKLGQLGSKFSLPADIIERLKDRYKDKYGLEPRPKPA
jgi:predicted metal-dependent phosphoesterase TrpH